MSLLKEQKSKSLPNEDLHHPFRKGSPPKKWQINIMSLLLILLGLLLAYFFLQFWPSGLAEQTKGDAIRVVYLFNSPVYIRLDAQLLLLVMIAGGLGSFIHTATSFGDYVGNESLTQSWFLWYILRPFIGMALAAIFYLVLRGGFLSAGTNTGSINPYGIAALAGLVGMFSKQATDKLDEVFNTLFRTAPGQGDSKRKDNLKNPIPNLTDLQPKYFEVDTQNLNVVVKGTGFVNGAVLKINGSNRETEFVDETELNAKLTETDVKLPGELVVSVTNPLPGGGESTKMKITISPKRVQE
jgi:hypothetical protein